MKIFAVFDHKAEAFLRPFFSETTGLALRGFTDAVNEAGHEMNRHPEDYVLYEFGEIDVQTGEGELLDTPKPIITAVNALKAPQLKAVSA